METSMEIAAAILTQTLVQQSEPLKNEIRNVKAGEDTPEYFARLFEPHYKAMLAMIKGVGSPKNPPVAAHLSVGRQKARR